MISLVIPTAGFYRHNEALWCQIGAIQADGFDLELILVVGESAPIPLVAALERSKITGLIVSCGPSFRVGAALHAGISHATHETVICMHDDLMPNNLVQLLEGLKAALKDSDLAVPILEVSTNPDQERQTHRNSTTRYIDRSCFAINKSQFSEVLSKLVNYEIDGYAAEIQVNAAGRGKAVTIVECGMVNHKGSATLRDTMNSETYAGSFKRDMAHLSASMGVPLELDSRPALPRILPKRNNFWEPYPLAEGQEYLINEIDAAEFHYRGKTEQRIKLGDCFSIPSLMDKYEVALVRHTGMGDALMATASLSLFKKLHPKIEIQVYATSVACDMMERCPAVDKVFRVIDWRQIPASAVDWSVGNGTEGTPAFGFFALGLQYTPGSPMSLSFTGTLLPGIRPIGIQLHGGWATKKWSKSLELARTLISYGHEVRLFGEGIEVPEEMDRYSLAGKISTFDELAQEIGSLKAWVGFDSGPSYLANALGVPSVWLFSTHDPRGLIGLCATDAPYETIWRGWPVKCLEEHGISCRHPHQGGACPLRNGTGANCIDDISVAEVVEKLNKVTGGELALQ